MPERDGTTVDVDARGIQAELAHAGERLRSTGLVWLDEVDGVDRQSGRRAGEPELRGAARGGGLGGMQRPCRIEVPVALSVILAGIRVSAVAVVATAPLAALVGGGTLGAYILQGLALSDEVRVFAAAVLVALLAILTELGFVWLQRRATSPGLESSGGGSAEASRMPEAQAISAF